MDYAVVVAGVGKRFDRYHPHRPLTLQETFAKGLRRIQPLESFWALRDITFNIERGTMVGLVGPNGSGKSTLLRLIGGVGRVDTGRIEVSGQIAALLDLGTCFHPDLTGRENVLISGVILGLTRRAVAQRFDSIVAFAELEEFIDNPVRTYSTGMQMRLAFAVSIHTDPEVLLIDEALSVGDHSFQSKCFERIRSFKAEGRTIVLVSHDVDQVREFCDAAIWLDSGRMILHGRPEVVVSQYVEEADRLLNQRALVDAATRLRTPKTKTVLTTSQGAKLRLNENRIGSLEVEIVDVLIVDMQGHSVTEIDSGGTLRIELSYHCSKPVLEPIFQVYVYRVDGLVCYDVNSECERWYSGTIEGDGQVALQINTAGLPSGLYRVEVGCWAKDWGYAYDYHYEVYSVNIHGSAEKISSPGSHQWEFNPGQVSEGRHSCG